LTVKFIVDVDGRVASAVDHGSIIPDPRVVECVVTEVRTLRFPKTGGRERQAKRSAIPPDPTG